MITSSFRSPSLKGGIMGAFATKALATFERVTVQRIVEYFDLIVGMSTGRVMAIGLTIGA
jgi:patatin-like phospholipase/acyl hydrolase